MTEPSKDQSAGARKAVRAFMQRMSDTLCEHVDDWKLKQAGSDCDTCMLEGLTALLAREREQRDVLRHAALAKADEAIMAKVAICKELDAERATVERLTAQFRIWESRWDEGTRENPDGTFTLVWLVWPREEIEQVKDEAAEIGRFLGCNKTETRAELQAKVERLERELTEARRLLNPNAPEETVCGAINNLRQALLTTQGNETTLEQRLAEAERELADETADLQEEAHLRLDAEMRVLDVEKRADEAEAALTGMRAMMEAEMAEGGCWFCGDPHIPDTVYRGPHSASDCPYEKWINDTAGLATAVVERIRGEAQREERERCARIAEGALYQPVGTIAHMIRTMPGELRALGQDDAAPGRKEST